MRSAVIVLMMSAGLMAQKYTGPVPEKPDHPYLLHASTLIPLDAGEAKEEKRKEGTAFVTAGSAAKARTPLAEPILILESKKIAPDKLSLYKLDVKNGSREVFLYDNPKKRRDAGKSYRLSVARLGNGLYRLEPTEPLPNGEYALTPDDSNEVFCFTIY
jgi:hypothetical protein